MKLLLILCLLAFSSPAWCDWDYQKDATTAGLSGVRIDGRAIPSLAGIPSGVCIQEVVSKGGAAVTQPSGDRFSYHAATTKSRGALLVDLVITDTRGGDSAARVFYQLPVDTTGWLWYDGLGAGKQVPADGLNQSIFPLSVLANPATGAGLAVAIAPDTPCIFAAGCSKERGLYIEAKLGFSSATNPPSRAHVRFAVFPVDGAWGMRAGLKSYYALFPKAYERRAMKEGLWLFHGNAISLPNPTQFAYHEMAELTEAQNSGKQASEMLAEKIYDKERDWGIELYPYVIPGQREVSFLKELKGEGTAFPKLAEEKDGETRLEDVHYTTAEAMAVLDAATEKNIGLVVATSTIEQFRDSIKICSLLGPDGDVVTMARVVPWAGKALTFPVNPNPFVPGVGKTLSIGASVLETCRGLLSSRCDGIYVDSLWRWGEFLNYRKDHFAVSRTLLTYGVDGRPALDNALEHLTFLEELGKIQHSKGRKVFGNGVRPGRFWHAQLLDVSGAEMGAAPVETFAFNRAASYKKPYLALDHNMGKDEARDRQFLAKCFLFGMYGSGDRDFYATKNYTRIKPIYDTYFPLQKEMNRLGWEPITAARPLTDGVLAERFGEGKTIYFSLYDSSESNTQADLELDIRRLKLSGKTLTATDPVSGKKLEIVADPEGKAQIRGIPISHDGVGVAKIES